MDQKIGGGPVIKFRTGTEKGIIFIIARKSSEKGFFVDRFGELCHILDASYIYLRTSAVFPWFDVVVHYTRSRSVSIWSSIVYIVFVRFFSSIPKIYHDDHGGTNV